MWDLGGGGGGRGGGGGGGGRGRPRKQPSKERVCAKKPDWMCLSQSHAYYTTREDGGTPKGKEKGG